MPVFFAVFVLCLGFFYPSLVDAQPLKKSSKQLIAHAQVLPPEPSSYIVYDVNAKKILAQKNSRQQRPIASLTKLLTAVTFLNASTEEFRRTGYVTLDSAQDLDTLKGTMLRLSLTKSYSVDRLFQLSMVNSNNNATFALSRSIPGVSREVFVNKMARTAAEIGMAQSFFEEPTGLSPKNVSTVEDLLKLALTARNYSEITNLAKVPQVIEEGPNGALLFFKNTNKLIAKDHISAFLSKTGYIKEAGFNLIFEPAPEACNGNNYLIILLGAKNALSRQVFMQKTLQRLKCSMANMR